MDKYLRSELTIVLLSQRQAQMGSIDAINPEIRYVYLLLLRSFSGK
jgi:hypothetical protein